MTDVGGRGRETTVLILAPAGKDAALAHAILNEAGIQSLVCSDAPSLGREATAGSGAILVTEEALDNGARRVLAEIVAGQPAWSDIPLLVVTREGADSATAADALAMLGNATLLERPLRVSTLASAVRTALRARARQYESRGRAEAQALLAAIVESSDDAIISKTCDGIITSWNTGAERLLGYSPAEIIGRSVRVLIPPDRLDEETMILQRINRGERIEHYETVRVSKAGRRIDISLSISPIRDSANRIVGASKVARDITHRKQAELALQEANRHKDEFLATLAHELRNPLAPIRNSLHILRMAGNLNPAAEHAREVIDRQVNHLVRLVDDLLEISRITRGKIDLRKQRIDLASVIHNAVEASTPLIESAGHALTLSLPTGPLTVEADPVRLTQVVTNLLNNAAHHAERGGQIWLSARREDAHAVVSVRDNGIGIPPEMLPRVFEIFVQLDGHGGRGGLGIGLTLVRALVALHGGNVTAYSEGLGKGSEFVVRLPLAADSCPTEALRLPADAAALAPLRVLVVDDNHDAADSLGELLQLLGLTVRVVYDGLAALETMRTFEPAVVLLDIGMHGINGYEVAERIRRQPGFQNVMLIALTGWGQEADRLRCRAAGFDHHLIKPADIETLQRLIAAAGNSDRRRRM